MLQRWRPAMAAAAVAAILVEPVHPEPPVTERFRYAEGFERGKDPVTFWLSYGKKFTVNSKGVTEERAFSGKHCFKLDVTFDEESRFLWHILLKPQVPVGGRLNFSGRLLVGEKTTGRVTIGVSYRFPPTKHSGCTAPNTFHGPTHGEWKLIQDDVVTRSRSVAKNVLDYFTDGVTADNVAPMLERIIIDMRGSAGQRVVVYLDDLELTGEVPTEEWQREAAARRWRPIKDAVDNLVGRWREGLERVADDLQGLNNLQPVAAAMRAEVLQRVAELRKQLGEMEQRGHLNRGEREKLVSFLDGMSHLLDNIRALSQREARGANAVVYILRPVSSIKILPTDSVLPGRVGETLSLTAAPGEYEPASFVVSALQELRSVQASATDLRGAAGRIPANAIDIKVVKCWWQAGTAWVGIRQDKSKRLLTPELLLNNDRLVRVDMEKQENYLRLQFPDGEREVWISDPTEVKGAKPMSVDKFPVRDSPTLLPVDIPAGTNKQFWVTVHVPKDAAPGAYVGRILLRSPAGVVSELRLSARVLPFELSPPYYVSSMDYHGRLDPSGKGSISSWLKSRTQFRNELADMVAHGLSNCQHYNITKDMLGEVLRIRAEVGMDNRTLYLKNTIPIGNPTDPESLARIKRDVKDILEFVKPFGVETVYFYGMDERRGEELASQRAAWQAVREAGGKIFVAGWGDNIELMGDIQDMHVRAGWPSREEVRRWHALGHKIFCYNNPQTGVENPVVYRRNFGLLLWKYDYDGAATNAYQHTFGTTWNDFDHPIFRAHTIAYPTVDGVIDTIAWEGYREGVDDVRYVTTLQRVINQGAESRDAAVRARVAAAKDFLQALKDGSEIENGDLDAIRRQIVEHVLALR